MGYNMNESIEAKPRSIDELARIAPAEMTAEELDIWIDYQAGIKAGEKTHRECVELQQQHLDLMKIEFSKQHEIASAEFQAECDAAAERLAAAKAAAAEA